MLKGNSDMFSDYFLSQVVHLYIVLIGVFNFFVVGQLTWFVHARVHSF